jgi:hypothetical protein
MDKMDVFLANFYGTKTASAPVPQAEDLEKQASVNLFTKLAADQGIDLKTCTDAQVNALYADFEQKVAAAGGINTVMAKVAAANPAAAAAPAKTASEKEEEEKREKMEAARREHEGKKEAAAKLAEADFMGRVMAHAYVQEMRKIASEGGGDDKGEGKHEMPEALRKGIENAKAHEHPADRKKEASALDDLAAEYAVALVFDAKLDPVEAGRKVASVLNLGIAKDTAKTASAKDLEGAVHIRALELLEAAGYPVQYPQ